MSSMPYLKKHPNGYFYIHWTDRRVGKRESTGTKDETQARVTFGQWLLDNGQEASAGVHLTLSDIWANYHKHHVLKKVANVYNADLAWKQMEPFFGSLPATGLTQDAIDEYVKRRTAGKLGRKVLPHTVTKELSYIIAAVKLAASDRHRLIGPESARRISLPEQAPARDRWLRPDEIEKIKEAAVWYRRGGRMSRGERFIWLALETGARRQAILDLTWDRVDMQTGTIQYADKAKRATKKKRAAVPISAALRPFLEQAYAERINDYVLDNKADVWPSVQNIVVRAGLAGEREPVKTGQKPVKTGIGPHTFRHTFATILARKKVPLYQIAAILGNSVQMVQRVYGHYDKDDLQVAVDLISPQESLQAA